MDYLQDQPGLLAVAIFLARILDVSIGTVRTILIIRGHRVLGALLGFVEILIWVGAAAQVITNLGTWYLVVAYAGGFATGNYAGSWIEARLALGSEIVRAISTDPDIDLGGRLRRERFDVLELTGRGMAGPVEVLLVMESRRRVPRLLQLIGETDPAAMCTISDVRVPARQGSPLPRGPVIRGGWWSHTKRK